MISINEIVLAITNASKIKEMNMQSGHLMGEAYEPHVTPEDGKLTYSLPVDSGFMSYNVDF